MASPISLAKRLSKDVKTKFTCNPLNWWRLLLAAISTGICIIWFWPIAFYNVLTASEFLYTPAKKFIIASIKFIAFVVVMWYIHNHKDSMAVIIFVILVIIEWFIGTTLKEPAPCPESRRKNPYPCYMCPCTRCPSCSRYEPQDHIVTYTAHNNAVELESAMEDKLWMPTNKNGIPYGYEGCFNGLTFFLCSKVRTMTKEEAEQYIVARGGKVTTSTNPKGLEGKLLLLGNQITSGTKKIAESFEEIKVAEFFEIAENKPSTSAKN